MAINVYPWPPVGAIGSEWTIAAPVSRMRSALTGRDQMQASQRSRRLASLQVSALSAGRMGAGYCEMLKHFLQGGIHAVRLTSSPINWHLDQLAREAALNSQPLNWQTGSDPLAWQVSGQPLAWFDGRIVTGGTPGRSAGWDTLPLSGLPANTLVARPGDFIRVYPFGSTSSFEIARVIRPATTGGGGGVSLRLDRAITITGGQVNLAGQDEGVFRVEGDLPRAVQPVGKDWSYSWSFREVFADEVGGFTEMSPWG